MMRIHHSQASDRRLPLAIAGSVVLIALAISSVHTPSAQAADANTPVNLGTTEQFAVLAGAGITNTGATSIQGDIGSHPTPSETIPGVTLEGASTNRAGGEVTQLAKDDLVTAYDDARLSSRPVEDPTELGGRTLVAGVYGNDTELGLTGTLTLTGDSDDVFVFQAGTTLITASGSSVVLAGEVQACNVFWQVGSSATFGTRTSFAGTVMALTSISAQQGATFKGRLLARNGAVTLINNTITRPGCQKEGDGTDGGGDGTDETDESGTDGTNGGGTGGTNGGGTDGANGGGTDGTDGVGGGTGGGAAGTGGGTDGANGGGADGGRTSDGSFNTSTSGGSASSSDALPDAGGPSAWLLAGGIGTLMVGATLAFRRRYQPLHSS